MRFRQASFIAFVFAWFFPKFYNNGGNQKLKAWSFQLRKNCFRMLNIKRPIAHQSSIIFLYSLYFQDLSTILSLIVSLRTSQLDVNIRQI